MLVLLPKSLLSAISQALFDLLAGSVVDLARRLARRLDCHLERVCWRSLRLPGAYQAEAEREGTRPDDSEDEVALAARAGTIIWRRDAPSKSSLSSARRVWE